MREGALHAAYLMLAGRALGLDCAPIWQFDAALVDPAFFPHGRMTANFLCALGYGEDGQTAFRIQAAPLRRGLRDPMTRLPA